MQSKSEHTSQTQPAPAQGHSTNSKATHNPVPMVSQYTDPGLNVQDNNNQNVPSTNPMHGRPRRMAARNSQSISKILFENERERLTLDEELVGDNSA